MNGIDIFIAILSAVMLFGGLYLNALSRRLADEYAEAHKASAPAPKPSIQKNTKVQKRNA